MKAVLVGINTYKNYPDEELRGCVPDMNNIWMLLADKMSFPEESLQALKNGMASAVAEKAAVLAMVNASGPGDHLVWSHSSHGSNNPDQSQVDGLQELLCSYDLQETAGHRWDEDTCITAKWIGQMVLKVHPQATLDIILDCCNAPAGGQLKAMGMSYSRARFIPRSARGLLVAPDKGQIKLGMVPPNVALWSACQPEQTSADAYIKGGFQGAFTYSFLQAWKPQRTRADIIATSRKWLTVNRYGQTPHLYCGQVMALKPFGE